MWKIVARLILRNRILILLILSAITVLMGLQIPKNSISHDLSNFLPKTDTVAFEYQNFKKKFGANDNLYFLATTDNIFTLKNFQNLYDFTEKLKKLPAVDSVFGVCNFYYLTKNQKERRFELTKIIKERPVR